jgi:ribosomal protein S5
MTFEEDIEYYKTIAKDLEKQHKGKFVLIKDKANIGIFSSFDDAHREALKRFGNTDVLIAQIGTDSPLNYLAPVI